MAVRKSPDGWVLFVFRRTKMCLGEAQALPGGSGGMLPRGKFWKNCGAKPSNIMRSGSKNRLIAAWSTHKKYTEIKQKISFGWADLVAAREGSSVPPEPPLGMGLQGSYHWNFFAQSDFGWVKHYWWLIVWYTRRYLPSASLIQSLRSVPPFRFGRFDILPSTPSDFIIRVMFPFACGQCL